MKTRLLRNFVLFLLLIFGGLRAPAQILSASVGINGLTCSQCSRSVEMQWRKLPFVQEVEMNLEHTLGTLIFRSGSKVDLNAVAGAVRDAGFSVRSLEAKIDMEEIQVQDDRSFRIDNGVYVILNDAPLPKGIVSFLFTGKKFSAKKAAYHRSSLPKVRGNQVLYQVIAGS